MRRIGGKWLVLASCLERYLAGEELGREFPVEADLVIGVPDSGTSAALGYSTATAPLLSEEGSFPGLGLIVTRGFKHILEIARQSVPQGYGNSYFWVKPERIVPVHLVHEVTERLDFRGNVLSPLDLDEAEAAAALTDQTTERRRS